MSWESDLEAAWAEIDETNRDDFVERIRSAVNDPSVPPEIREFEIACAHDSTGAPTWPWTDIAEPSRKDWRDTGAVAPKFS